MLDSRDSAIRYEVIVLARSGYSTSQELVLLERQALPLDPDLVIWSYVLNDPADPVFHDANGQLGLYFFKPRIHLAHFVHKKLFKARENWHRKKCRADFHEMLHCVYRVEVEKNIGSIAELTAERTERGLPILFTVHPNVVSYEDYPFADLHRELVEIAGRNELYVLDLLEDFGKEDVANLQQSENDPWHPNARGHHIVAQAIFERLHALKLLSEEGRGKLRSGVVNPG